MEIRINFLFKCIFFLVALKKTAAILHNSDYNHQISHDLKINKVVLTQKGYIQFLRYINDVPLLHEYTFCIWLRSHNFTYSHPILSYSKHEEERLIRVWISDHGKYMNAEILENHIFKIPVNLKENVWNHICQSWSSSEAQWSVYLNGKLKGSGFYHMLEVVPIKEGGDIVVGQEYTDFDKGLDDGIEGDIFGFNFVLSAASFKKNDPPNFYLRRNVHKPQSKSFNQNHYTPYHFTHRTQDNSNPLTYLAPPMPPRRRITENSFRTSGNKNTNFLIKVPPYVSDGLPTTNIAKIPKSLGLKLVELSYDCGFAKGAPLSGKGVLINWAKTTVRVFGGAILKSVPPFCYAR